MRAPLAENPRAICAGCARWPLRVLAFWKTVTNIGGIFCRQYSDSARSKKVRVLAEFVRHLVNDESAARR